MQAGNGHVVATTERSLEPTRLDGNNVNLDTETLSNIDTVLRYQFAARAMDDQVATDAHRDEDQLMALDAIGIAGTALTVHRKWLDAVSDNLANMNTVSATSGNAFQARYVIAQEGQGNSGVYVAGTALGDPRGPPRLRARPPARRRKRLRALPGHRHGRPNGPAHPRPARLPGQRRRCRPRQRHLPGRTPDWTPMIAIPSVGTVQGVAGTGYLPAVGNTAATDGSAFSGVLSGAVDNLQQLQSTSDTLAIQAVTGNLNDIHSAVLASTRAQVSLELVAAVRNKAVDAFNEIMRMQA